MDYKYHNQFGQSLLEMIIAITVISVALFSILSLFLSNMKAEEEARLRIVGSNLAQEGVEVVRNIRDSNWLKSDNNQSCGEQIICSWDYGLIGLTEEEINQGFFYSVRGLFSEAGDLVLNKTNQKADSQLYLDDRGFYVQDDIYSKTVFQRFIYLKDLCCSDFNNDLRCDENDFFQCNQSETDLKVGLEVEVRTAWQVNGRDRDTVLLDQLFNWK